VKNVPIKVEEKCNLTIIMDEWDQKRGIIMMYGEMFHFDCMCASNGCKNFDWSYIPHKLRF
jgi:hypothetical protein